MLSLTEILRAVRVERPRCLVSLSGVSDLWLSLICPRRSQQSANRKGAARSTFVGSLVNRGGQPPELLRARRSHRTSGSLAISITTQQEFRSSNRNSCPAL